ncbi:alpha-ketoacid dehydrogenase subunit beta [Nonomuraea sp. JJY05]|uniref:alpha-ketoacid dehydrogenase subunit beta n=1 Tax=Nonomuraea sp. JJY05 TaxID=3350255 RepID=UPI00373F9B36
MTTASMAQALNAALRDALREDERVLVFGEDVGPLGGVFRVTDGLTREFGEERCFDTPLAEAGIVGLAVGLAMGGFRPVIEMQFDAFAYPAFEQIASHVAYGVALQAAEAAAQDGLALEVVDLRTIVPFDDATVVSSVRKTGRCVVIQEAQGFAGVGAEIAARVQERCFHSPAAPVLRVTGFDIPYPPPILEHSHLPDADRVLDAVDRLQFGDAPDLAHLAGEAS